MENINRRNFFKLGLTALTIPTFIKAVEAACPAKPMPKLKKWLDPKSKKASKKGYVLNASEASKLDAKYSKKYAKHLKAHTESNVNCAKCKWYKGAKEKNGYSSCSMFANAQVSACGWCNLYKFNPKA